MTLEEMDEASRDAEFVKPAHSLFTPMWLQRLCTVASNGVADVRLQQRHRTHEECVSTANQGSSTLECDRTRGIISLMRSRMYLVGSMYKFHGSRHLQAHTVERHVEVPQTQYIDAS